MSTHPGLVAKGKWSAEECRLFRVGCTLHGWGSWMEISKMIPARTNIQVKSHAYKALKKMERKLNRSEQDRHKEQNTSTPKPKQHLDLVTKPAAPDTILSVRRGLISSQDAGDEGNNANQQKLPGRMYSEHNVKQGNNDALERLFSSDPLSGMVSFHDQKQVLMTPSAMKMSISIGREPTCDILGDTSEGNYLISVPIITPEQDAKQRSDGALKHLSSPDESLKEVSYSAQDEPAKKPIAWKARRKSISRDIVDKSKEIFLREVTQDVAWPAKRKSISRDIVDKSKEIYLREVSKGSKEKIANQILTLHRDSSGKVSYVRPVRRDCSSNVERASDKMAHLLCSMKYGHSSVDNGRVLRDPLNQFYVLDRTHEPGYPSNYDVLGGPNREYFDHIGNRRFRIMIEMRLHRYVQLCILLEGDNIDDEGAHLLDFLNDVLQSLATCNPPCRFLALDMYTGRWQVLNDYYARW
eukprot:CAMPEP_0181091362 /NCGR_PEP_ID=MMETSP1071-20121207/8357_1 /TAXON_ID=35127 /ORGANISM="Thalassiosira sp., Strain NH16" /LENGTH=467 /DNA_ID=CAMNT_0023173495 /DNA_START=1144 /DNA_END=2544 /DNA_ORIENTATION=+